MSKESVKKLQKIIEDTYGIVIDEQEALALGERILRLLSLANKHCQRDRCSVSPIQK